MNRVCVAEEIMYLSECLLISTYQEHPDVIVPPIGRVQLQHAPHVAQIDELVDLAIRVAGEIGEYSPA